MPVTSGASRNIVKLTAKFKINLNTRRLVNSKKSRAGRGSSGSVIVRTKASLKFRVFLKSVAFKWRLRILGFISSLEINPFSHQLLSLTVLASGGLCFFPMVFSDELFKFRFFTPRRKKFRALVDTPTFSLFRRCALNSKVSNVELIPGKGAQYARSAGCFAKIIKLDPDKHLTTVQLPSGVRKIFSIHSALSLGPSGLKERRLLKNTKAGFYKRYGKKSITRGVARNPVDHPHGGRTKSIKWPRTPWGKTTKLK